MPRLISVIFVAILVSGLVAAQQWEKVSPEEAASHLIKKIDPVYPAFAKAAGVQGSVQLHIGIGLTGRMETLTEMTGPPSLRQAALDAVRQYHYKPFEKDGRPAAADTTVTVVFKLEGNVPPPPPPPAVSMASFSMFEHPVHSNGHFAGWKCTECVQSLSPELRKWLAADLKKLFSDVPGGDYSDCPPVHATLEALSDAEDPLPEGLEGLEVLEVPVKKGGTHLYLLRPHFQCMCGASGNCAIELVEADASGIRSVAKMFGGAYSIQPHPGSPYPDVFTYAHMSAFEGTVEAYSNAGGEWGQLYCGKITWSEEQRVEKDDVHVCR